MKLWTFLLRGGEMGHCFDRHHLFRAVPLWLVHLIQQIQKQWCHFHRLILLTLKECIEFRFTKYFAVQNCPQNERGEVEYVKTKFVGGATHRLHITTMQIDYYIFGRWKHFTIHIAYKIGTIHIDYVSTLHIDYSRDGGGVDKKVGQDGRQK